MKKLILFAILLNLVLVPICFAQTNLMTAQEKRAKALELVDKYAANQDEIQRSFVVKTDMSSVYSGSVYGKTLMADKLKMYEFSELSYDSNRVSLRTSTWGQRSARTKVFIPKDNASYTSELWDGQKYFVYRLDEAVAVENPLGRISIYQEPDQELITPIISKSYCGHELLGFFYGKYERVDLVLRKAETLTVKNTLERIGDSDCYVVEADTEGVKYTLWIDPQHGYNIARATVKWSEQSPPYGMSHWIVKNAFNSLSNVNFKKTNNLWVSAEADIVLNRNWHNGEWTKQSWHCKVTEIVLNPDHDKLRSFSQYDVKDGADIRVVMKGNRVITDMNQKYTWRDGKVVGSDGREVDLDK
ncbi:MAG: hypothetical protein ACYTE8_04630 [Planctomycetota bacterium]|jgi:hypothetical protein